MIEFLTQYFYLIQLVLFGIGTLVSLAVTIPNRPSDCVDAYWPLVFYAAMLVLSLVVFGRPNTWTLLGAALMICFYIPLGVALTVYWWKNHVSEAKRWLEEKIVAQNLWRENYVKGAIKEREEIVASNNRKGKPTEDWKPYTDEDLNALRIRISHFDLIEEFFGSNREFRYEETTVQSIRPQAARFKNKIVGKILYWPAELAYRGVFKITDTIFSSVKKTFQEISDKIFE